MPHVFFKANHNAIPKAYTLANISPIKNSVIRDHFSQPHTNLSEEIAAGGTEMLASEGATHKFAKHIKFREMSLLVTAAPVKVS